MAWDKDLPDGTKALNLGDNDIRTNNAQLETALDEEHQFATGGVQTGRHKLPYGNDAARTTAHPSPVAGNIWLNSVDYSTHGWVILQRYNGSTWDNIGFYDSDVAWITEQKNWTAGQSSTFQSVSESVGGPGNQWDWDPDSGLYWKGTLSDDTIINDPTGSLYGTSNRGSFFLFEVTQDASSPYSVTFGSAFKPSGGTQPDVDQTLSSVTLIYCTLRSNQDIVYTVEYTA